MRMTSKKVRFQADDKILERNGILDHRNRFAVCAAKADQSLGRLLTMRMNGLRCDLEDFVSLSAALNEAIETAQEMRIKVNKSIELHKLADQMDRETEGE